MPRCTDPSAVLLPACLALLLLAAASAFGADPQPADEASGTLSPLEALRRGNRLARRGDPAGAAEAFRSAGPAALRSDPVLAYNLAASLHRLGELPEAVLWYRRARIRLGDDPWLEDNLELARRRLEALGAERRPPVGAAARVAAHRWLLPVVAAAAAWGALVLGLLGLRRPGGGRAPNRLHRGAAGLLAAAALLWAAQLTADHLGPRPAVLLAPCGPTLQAGSEVWVRPLGDGGYEVLPEAAGARGSAAGETARCPDGAVAPV